jgi:predicted kinase
MVCGSTGAGKTAFAREVATSLNTVMLSIDEWMISLFGPVGARLAPKAASG